MTGNLTILGGGPAGLGAAFYAHRAGFEFVLFEKAPEFGGLCRTFRCGKHRYDAGAHRFHDADPEVTAVLRELLGDKLVSVFRPSKVFVRGRYLGFPPTPTNLLLSAGLGDLGRMSLDLLRGRLDRRPVVSFADFAVKAFGKTLAERFLLNYSAKVWGLPPDQLSPAIATRRLSGMSLWTLMLELVNPQRKTEHLEGRFLYPTGGHGEIIRAIVGTLPRSSLKENSEVCGLDVEAGAIRGVRLSDGSSWPVRGPVVSTLPLPALVRFLAPCLPPDCQKRAADLRFRQVRLIFLRLSRPRFSENASIYIPNPDLCVSRIYEPKNRCESMAPPGETSIVVECPCFPNDEIGQTADQALCERVIGELESLSLLDRQWVLDWEHRLLPDAYPVYALKFEETVNYLVKALGVVSNVELLGRGGLFLYSHLHHQLRFGRDLVDSLRDQSTPRQRIAHAVGVR
jgi:protoporphyrinogen oxidase